MSMQPRKSAAMGKALRILLEEVLQDFGDIGVIDEAREAFCARAFGGGEDGEGGVCARGPADAALMGKDVLDGGYELLFVGEGFFEFGFFGACEDHRIFGGVAFKFEAKVCGEEGCGGFEVGRLFAMEIIAEGIGGALLIGEAVHIKGVACAGEAHGHAACFVVARDDDEGIWIFLLEGESDFDGVIESEDVAEVGGGVIGVACPVDFAAFDHHEEAVGVVEDFEAFCGEFGEGWDAFPEVRVD